MSSDLRGLAERNRPDPGVAALRSVHRAMAELRRGAPVLLRGPGAGLIVLAAETVGAWGLREAERLADGPAVLLLSPVRAAALLRLPAGPGEAAALRTGGLLAPEVLRGVADPTAAQLLAEPPETAPVPPLGPAALALVKLARLLPTVVALPARADAAAGPEVLAVAAEDVSAYGLREAASLRRVSEAAVPLAEAPDARLVVFRPEDGGIEHLAIVVGDPAHVPPTDKAPLVRVHSECFTGDLLGSLRCDCGPQLQDSLRRIAAEGSGVILYLAQEGRGIGLAGKLRAYALQDRGLDTVDANRALGWEADERSFAAAAAMLEQIGVTRVRLLTNNPDKLAALAACGIEVTGRVRLLVAGNGVNDHYLDTKLRRLGHLE